MRATTLLAACITVFAFSSELQAADANGVWQTEGGKAQVRLGDCGGALCGTIVGLSEPNNPNGRPKTDENNADPAKRSRPMIGVQILIGMKPQGPNKWAGDIYNAEDGKIYSGSFTLISDTSGKIEGCVMGGLICRGQNWTRAK
jgi:uncharacterized protein (DUF2147 family)